MVRQILVWMAVFLASDRHIKNYSTDGLESGVALSAAMDNLLEFEKLARLNPSQAINEALSQGKTAYSFEPNRFKKCK
jgi:hypothetical protein